MKRHMLGCRTALLQAAPSQFNSCRFPQSMTAERVLVAILTEGHSVSADSCGAEAAAQALAPLVLCLWADVWLPCRRPRMPGSG